MNKFLSTLHRWLGLPLGLLFLVSFGSGCLTAVDELLQRYQTQQQNVDFQFRATTLEEQAQVLQQITQQSDNIRFIGMPTVDHPYYEVVGRGQRTLYEINSLIPTQLSDEEHEGFFSTVLQLHRNFLLGNEGLMGVDGKHYVAWTALLALLLSLIGVWIWWPLRKSFTLRDLVPRGRKRKNFYYNHMTAGLMLLPIIIMLALTGASITYRSIAQQLLTSSHHKPAHIAPTPINQDWLGWLQAAHANMPAGSELARIHFPRPQREMRNQEQRGAGKPRPGAVENPNQMEFRFITPDDWLGMAGSKVLIDRENSTLNGVEKFAEMSTGTKIYSILVPLHTGRQLPAYYTVLLLLLSSLGTVMVASGIISFLTKKRKRTRRSRTLPIKPTLQPEQQ